MSRTIYLHGLPGGAEELGIGTARPDWNVPDRLDWQGYETGLAALAKDLPEHCRLVGFSLGAMTALRLAARQPAKVESITLVSPAAPLELGDFLPKMAGAAVFRAARASSGRLAWITRIQARLTRIMPGLMMRLLFSKSDDTERKLARAHSDLLLRLIGRSYGPGRAAYLDELRHYVLPWSDVLSRVSAPVTIHHGSADRWSPPAMAEALCTALPRARFVGHEGCGHYGTLASVLDARRLS